MLLKIQNVFAWPTGNRFDAMCDFQFLDLVITLVMDRAMLLPCSRKAWDSKNHNKMPQKVHESFKQEFYAWSFELIAVTGTVVLDRLDYAGSYGIRQEWSWCARFYQQFARHYGSQGSSPNVTARSGWFLCITRWLVSVKAVAAVLLSLSLLSRQFKVILTFYVTEILYFDDSC